MLLNKSSIRMVAASRIQKILRMPKVVEVVVVNKIFRHSMAVHHSAVLIIAIAQAYLKLGNTVEIIALASAVQKQSRKYCKLVVFFEYFGFNYFGVGFDTRGGAACF